MFWILSVAFLAALLFAYGIYAVFIGAVYFIGVMALNYRFAHAAIAAYASLQEQIEELRSKQNIC